MALDSYRAKRNFKATPEPKGRKSRKRGDRFVIQKHAARRLHYDLRLELDGVFKSWAVTRGPSLVAGEKRLAVHVEDHPLDYGDFEGEIPKGEYGAGKVIVWDRGSWSPLGDAARGYAKGHLEFELAGEKLSGRWHLVRMQGKTGETRENWLLIKAEDEAARPADAPDILTEAPQSVLSGRGIDDPPGATTRAEPEAEAETSAGDESAAAPAPPKGSRKERMPDFVAPMLATLVPSAPKGDRWLHEIKFDGYRLQARVTDGRATLLTRSGLDWTDRFGPALIADLAALPAGAAILDGEVVVETGAGASDFSALQADLSEGRHDRFVFYAFDILHLDGKSLRAVPLEDRKAVLESLLAETGKTLRYSSHFEESGAMVLRHACRLSLEGIVSKLRDSPYRSGRGKAWVKSKCSARQEFVIGGYVPSTTSDQAIGSLVLGLNEKAGLHPVGRVGTGFSASVATDLYRRLEDIRTDESPFSPALTTAQARQVRYVRPDLVAEVEFRAWTADGHLRHAAFRGLREDKPAAEVVRESTPATKRGTPRPPSAKGGISRPPAAGRGIPRPNVTLTHPDRVYWPDAGVTKEGLADYYAQVWRRMGPLVVNRPLALLRCPSGITGQRFFQKHAWKGMNRNIATLSDPKSPGDSLISISDLDGLIGLVQAAALEIHPWGSSAEDWERPDMIVMDLDPGDGVGWGAVVEGAAEVRQRLADAGLESFVKISGGKGVHVTAPLKPHATWPEVKAFCKGIADAMARDTPDRYVSTIAKARRKGKILIDYLRNQRGATAVAAYSSRARPGAPVSVPVGWDELPELTPDHFSVATLPARLDALSHDPWEGFFKSAKPLRSQKKGRKG
ncbi:DNA ligase D [Halodurantibacterium flavum]|uniref:DNA ligase (ATP) n=1 Tax=Halodurantibacterium flavum TaxID=1382802 RepID=A0ABW4S039_9RHOB